ncbi:MAG: hypothetical protein M3298_08825 [Thermoproteota archaeon]|nr:hypothetical protein [Thermoproteota archaeon]
MFYLLMEEFELRGLADIPFVEKNNKTRCGIVSKFDDDDGEICLGDTMSWLSLIQLQ